MYKIIMLILICCPVYNMEKAKVKKRRELTKAAIQTDSVQCPYCCSKQKSLETHLLEHHKIDCSVINECARAITTYNAIKKSRYKIASLACECNQFFCSKKALERHQCSAGCPIIRPAKESYFAAITLPRQSIKKEPVDSCSTHPPTLPESIEKTEYFGDALFEEIIFSQSMNRQ